MESKRLHQFGSGDVSKGHPRYDKHVRQKDSNENKYASEGPGVDLLPEEETKVAGSERPNEEIDNIIRSREEKTT